MHNESVYHLQAAVISEHVPKECCPWKRARKPLLPFPLRTTKFFLIFFFGKWTVHWDDCPQGDQTAAQENWSVMAIQHSQWDHPPLLGNEQQPSL